jgi:hypothetical protein
MASAGTKACASGNRRLAGGALAWRAMKRLAMRSSSEWKLMTASRPAGLSAATLVGAG